MSAWRWFIASVLLVPFLAVCVVGMGVRAVRLHQEQVMVVLAVSLSVWVALSSLAVAALLLIGSEGWVR
jgi:hypothetical protein